MSIKELSTRRRLPRLGKIHTGIKVKNSKGVEHPQPVDYFVVPPEVQKVYDEKPKELKIMFPLEDETVWASQFYKLYSSSRGLICKGDGALATQLQDTKTGKLATKDSTQAEMTEVECAGRECEYYGEKCREVMMLQFMLPDVPGLGVYQLDTSSINSMININSAVEMIKGFVGHIAGIPLTLVLESQEVSPEGKKKIVHVLNLKIDVKLADLKKQQALPAPSDVELPPVDDVAPTEATWEGLTSAAPVGDGTVTTAPDLHDEPAEPKTKEYKPKEKQEFPMNNLGHLFSACFTKYNMRPAEVLKELGVSDKQSIGDVEQAWQKVQAAKGRENA